MNYSTRRTGANGNLFLAMIQLLKETTAGNMEPAANGQPDIAIPGNEFSPRPIKHWRRQRTQVYPNHGFTNSRTLQTTFEVPGATTVVPENTVCDPCENQYLVPAVDVTYRPTGDINNKVGKFAPQSFADYSDFLNQCPPNEFQYEKWFRSVILKQKRASVFNIQVASIRILANQNTIRAMHLI